MICTAELVLNVRDRKRAPSLRDAQAAVTLLLYCMNYYVDYALIKSGIAAPQQCKLLLYIMYYSTYIKTARETVRVQ